MSSCSCTTLQLHAAGRVFLIVQLVHMRSVVMNCCRRMLFEFAFTVITEKACGFSSAMSKSFRLHGAEIAAPMPLALPATQSH
jgi:hypothetical protein